MLVMFIWWMTFGTAYYIVNLNRVEGSASDMVPQITNLWTFNAFEMQYEMSVGEINYDAFKNDNESSPILAYGLFIGSTFLVQIVFLNMLVAIMGDTFA